RVFAPWLQLRARRVRRRCRSARRLSGERCGDRQDAVDACPQERERDEVAGPRVGDVRVAVHRAAQRRVRQDERQYEAEAERKRGVGGLPVHWRCVRSSRSTRLSDQRCDTTSAVWIGRAETRSDADEPAETAAKYAALRRATRPFGRASVATASGS